MTQPVVETHPPATQPPPASTSKTFTAPEISSTPQPAHSTQASELNEPLPTPPPVTKVNKSDQAKQNKPQRPPNRPTEPKQGPAPRNVYALPAGPAAPVSADKVQKLNMLLQQYQADRVTPEQYQQERAKILAGP
jgi:hypothetical protein